MIDNLTAIDRLLASSDASIRWKVRVNVLGEEPASESIRDLQEQIRNSPRTHALLHGAPLGPWEAAAKNVYTKWKGAHWILASLADIGFPPGDQNLLPLRDRVLDTWLSEDFYKEFDVQDGSPESSRARYYYKHGVPRINGRHRRCASQQGNALYALLRLGLDDGRTQALAERLLHWQWPDGGWNCDRKPEAAHSSFMETLLPLRGLALYGPERHDPAALQAARQASEVFLKRRLFRRLSDGSLIHPEFTRLHYPLYWHYDVLGGLKVMAEAGLIGDTRCSEALDLLESKQLPDGGWPAERKYYRVAADMRSGAESVDWGGTSKRKMNEWVTADALFVLRTAGRLR